jgi:hypothetical protein
MAAAGADDSDAIDFPTSSRSLTVRIDWVLLFMLTHQWSGSLAATGQATSHLASMLFCHLENSKS